MIPNGVDLKKDRTWTRSQCTFPFVSFFSTHFLISYFLLGFGATCSIDLKPGETTHLVCGKAGTEKLRTALKCTQPLFLVSGQWLQDSMDNFHRMVRFRNAFQVPPIHSEFNLY